MKCFSSSRSQICAQAHIWRVVVWADGKNICLRWYRWRHDRTNQAFSWILRVSYRSSLFFHLEVWTQQKLQYQGFGFESAVSGGTTVRSYYQDALFFCFSVVIRHCTVFAERRSFSTLMSYNKWRRWRIPSYSFLDSNLWSAWKITTTSGLPHFSILTKKYSRLPHPTSIEAPSSWDFLLTLLLFCSVIVSCSFP